MYAYFSYIYIIEIVHVLLNFAKPQSYIESIFGVNYDYMRFLVLMKCAPPGYVYNIFSFINFSYIGASFSQQPTHII